MGYHVLILPEQIRDRNLRISFEHNEVVPEYSYHGPDRLILYMTWAADDVSLDGLRATVSDHATFSAVPLALYTDVIEPPYRTQPALLDHGRLVQTWEPARVSQEQPDLALLSPATRTAIVKLQHEHLLDGWPEVRQDGDTTFIVVRWNNHFRFSSWQSRIEDVIEATGDPEGSVRVRFELYDPFEARRPPHLPAPPDTVQGDRRDPPTAD